MANRESERTHGAAGVQHMRVILRVELEVNGEDCLNDIVDELNQFPQWTDGSIKKFSIEVDREKSQSDD